jgi:lipoyl-dependent peroxiredoxin
MGSISTETGVLREAPYGFKARFEGGKGTNPEELIGAAHAGCFSMALSMILGDAGLKADSIDTHGRSDPGPGGGWLCDHCGAPGAQGQGARREPGAVRRTEHQKAKEGCPVSKVLNATITLDATLVS